MDCIDVRDKEDVQNYYRQSQKLHPGESRALIACRAILRFLDSNKMDTMAEFNHRLDAAFHTLCDADSMHSSIRASCLVFKRRISLNVDAHTDFDKCRLMMLQRAREWVETMGNAQSTIAKSAASFIMAKYTVLTNGYSPCVLEVFRAVVKQGTPIHVIVTMSEPDKLGLRTAEAVTAMGIGVEVVVDAAVMTALESVNMVLVGADYIVSSGGVIGRIGTYLIACSAKSLHVPFTVVVESLRFLECYPHSQRSIPREIMFRQPPDAGLDDRDTSTVDVSSCSLENVTVDYTPPQYINHIISDLGIHTPGAILDEFLNVYG